MSKVTINKISTNIVENYSEQDLNLIPSFDLISQFNPQTDVVEFSIYNEQNLLEYIDYNYKNYKVVLDYSTNVDTISSVNVDPEEDIIKAGFDQGTYTATYNFLRNSLSSSLGSPYYIKELSSDRTELRIANNDLSNTELEEAVSNFKIELEDSAYFEDFKINFGNGNIYLANNILIDNTNEDQYTVLIKLYESLESQFGIKDTLTVALQTGNETSFQVNFPPKPVAPPSTEKIQGPNFNLDINNQINTSTTFTDKKTLFASTPQNPLNTPWSSSLGELQNILKNKGITPNIDYTDFNNFVYFSSAEERVKNFYYKVGLIQDYSASISELNTLSNAQNSGSIAGYQTKINNILENFDGYETYQYYSSGSSDVYPKINNTPPYLLALTGSNPALSWLETQGTTSGSVYDAENPDRLINSLPGYVTDDTRNAPFLLFMDMVGQHFDNIWVYTTDVSNRFSADNRLKYGISKDIVADAIKSMGVNLYQNNFTSDNLFSSLTGLNPGSGSLFPTGSEVIETIVTASSELTVIDDVNKEFYKRIFHNLPLLLKQKGSVAGLRTLINTFGVPDSILNISEFGGKDKLNSNDYDFYQSRFNYAGDLDGQDSDKRIFINNFELDSNWGSLNNKPETISFRFKWTGSLPEQETFVGLFNYNSNQNDFLGLAYTGSGFTSASYSGSIPSASKFEAAISYIDNAGEKARISGNFLDGNWWGVQLSTGSNGVVLRAANKIYNGADGFKIGQTLEDIPGGNLGDGLENSTEFYFPSYGNLSDGSNTYNDKGDILYQELRFYNTPLSESVFHDYVMNPLSIEGNTPFSSSENVVFRAPIGSSLDRTGSTTKSSIHPKSTGSVNFITNSFASPQNNNYYFNLTEDNFKPNNEFTYSDQPAVGIKNRVLEKIRTETLQLPSGGGNTLSPLTSIQQNFLTKTSGSYTPDTNLLEIALSPQNEINDDINNSFGYFNIGEYIGDPRQISESVTSYKDLDQVRDTYFKKYYKNYDWNDYIRLIKFFDNSLFKMIKDFAPTKTSLATGVVIKQHILERNKYKPPAVEPSLHAYSGSLQTGFITGSGAGVFNDLNQVSPQVTQSWAYEVPTISGSVTVTQSAQDEFYNGELSGSTIIAEDGELVTPLPSTFSVDPFIQKWTNIYIRSNPRKNLWDGYNGTGAFTIDTQINKFVGLAISNRTTPSPNDYNFFFKRLAIGNTLTLKIIVDNTFSPSITVPSSVKNFTITSIQPTSGTNANELGWNIGLTHDWEPSDTWAELVNGRRDDTFNDGNFQMQIIYDGSPLGPIVSQGNPQLNNVNDSRTSNIYEDVDYSSNASVPVNFDLIKEGKALKANIQDSNYSKFSWINGRYNGSRISSLDFNISRQS